MMNMGRIEANQQLRPVGNTSGYNKNDLNSSTFAIVRYSSGHAQNSFEGILLDDQKAPRWKEYR